jgi:hypothetical protein
VRQQLALIAIGLASCTSPPDCSPFVACGGNAVGDWHIAGTCNQPTTSSCGEQLDVKQDFQGSLTLSGDGTYILDATVAATGKSNEPASCFMTPPSSCALLGSNVNGVTTTCSGDPQASCACTIDEPRGGAYEVGTFITATNSISFQPMGDKPYGGQYCASANELRIQLTNPLGTVVIVLTR